MTELEDYSEQEPFNRDRYGRPLIVDPDTGELVAYMRASSFAGLLTDKYLETYHQWWAVKAAVMFPDEAAVVAGSPTQQKGQAKPIKDMVHRAGMHEKRDRGQARHTLVRKALTGAALPDLTEQQFNELQAVVDAINGLGFIEAVEMPLVCDELQVAGQADYVGEGVDGPFIADLKTGSRYKGSSEIEWGLQLIAYARGQRWDRGSGTRRGYICPTLPKLYIVHAPQDEPTVDVIELDPKVCMKLAHAAMAVRDARQYQPVKKGVAV